MPAVRIGVCDQQDGRSLQIGLDGEGVGRFCHQAHHARRRRPARSRHGGSFQEDLPRRIESGIKNRAECFVPFRDDPDLRHEHQPRSGRHGEAVRGDRPTALRRRPVGRDHAAHAQQRGEDRRDPVKLDGLAGCFRVETLRGRHPLGVAARDAGIITPEFVPTHAHGEVVAVLIVHAEVLGGVGGQKPGVRRGEDILEGKTIQAGAGVAHHLDAGEHAHARQGAGVAAGEQQNGTEDRQGQGGEPDWRTA